jgi:hypothetical protein
MTSDNSSGDDSSGDDSSGDKPKFEIPKVDLRSSIKMGVKKTNDLLATLEETNVQTSSMVSSRLRPLLTQMYALSQKGVVMYELRKYYGPQIIGVTAITVGGLVAARRGKVPGLFSGGVSGVGAYGFTYGNPSDFFMTEKK